MTQVFDNGSPDPQRAGFVRPLGYMERLFHLYASEHPRHICVVAQISGDIDALDFPRAFDAVQLRHPMLSVYIGAHAQHGPSVFRAPHRSPVPLSVMTDATGQSWQAIVERELRTAFDDAQAPLMRAVVLRARNEASIVLTVHHALLDGLSAAQVVGDLLKALNGRALELQPTLPSVEQMLEEALLPPRKTLQPKAFDSIHADGLREIARRSLWRPFEGDRPHIAAAGFSAAQTKRLRQRSKSERTTVHGALCAALVRSAVRAPRAAFTITSAINVRGLLRNVDSHVGLLACGATVRLATPFDWPFWDIARRVTDELAPARTGDGMMRRFAAIGGCMPADADSEIACGVMGALAYDAIVTNLGALPLNTQVGTLRVNSFWGPFVQGRFRNEIVIGAATLGDELRIVQSSPAHIAPLVEAMRAELLDACRDAQ